jgi:hypothetical protein
MTVNVNVMPATGSVVPSPWVIVHIPRHIDLTAEEDDHGNQPIVEGDPVLRPVMSLSQFGRRGSSRELISPDYLLRSETELHMSVANPEVYSTEDLVLVWPQWDDAGNWIPESGTAYWVDGVPTDERTGPWPFLLCMFGGVVKLRRVT